MFSKIDVNGPNTHPVWKFLKSKMDVSEIGWNFEKFLVGKDGHVPKHFAETVQPSQLEKDIADLLG